jgi:hypothetical protein
VHIATIHLAENQSSKVATRKLSEYNSFKKSKKENAVKIVIAREKQGKTLS